MTLQPKVKDRTLNYNCLIIGSFEIGELLLSRIFIQNFLPGLSIIVQDRGEQG